MKRTKYFLAALLMFSAVCGTLGGCSDSETEQAHNEERIEYDLTNPSLINLYKGELYEIGLELEAEEETAVTVSVYSDRGEKRGEISLEGIEGTVTC